MQVTTSPAPWALPLAASEGQRRRPAIRRREDQPGLPRCRECRTRATRAARRIRRPALFESRSPRPPPLSPALRGRRGRPAPASGGALSVARRSPAHSVPAEAGAPRAAHWGVSAAQRAETYIRNLRGSGPLATYPDRGALHLRIHGCSARRRLRRRAGQGRRALRCWRIRGARPSGTRDPLWCLASTGQCTTPDVAHRLIPPGRCRAVCQV